MDEEQEREQKEKIHCPGEIYTDKIGNPYVTKWHENGKCDFCDGHGRRRFVDGMPEIDRYGNPVVDFCCHQCKENLKDVKRQYRPTSVA